MRDTELIVKFYHCWRDKYRIDMGELTIEGILAEAHDSVKPTLEELLKAHKAKQERLER